MVLTPTALTSPGKANTPCPDDYRPLGRVTDVSATELTIANGVRLRLAAINVGTDDPADRAKLEHVLRAEAVGREARIATAKADMDRYGRLIALVRLDEAGVSSFENLQESLLRRGFVIARPEAGFIGCLPALLTAEYPARALKRGVWSRLPIPTSHIDALKARRGGFTIMAGRVRSVGNTRAIDYLNFDVKWREDATVRIDKTVSAELIRRGTAVDQFLGRYVVVRGYVVEAGGPAIDVAWPEQIELPAAWPKDTRRSGSGLAAEPAEAQETQMVQTTKTPGAEQAGTK